MGFSTYIVNKYSKKRVTFIAAGVFNNDVHNSMFISYVDFVVKYGFG